jgi:hypothetical protein
MLIWHDLVFFVCPRWFLLFRLLTQTRTTVYKWGTNEDIRRRLDHARLAYNKFKSVWNNSQFGRKTKMKLLKWNVLSVLLYGSETWKMTKGTELSWCRNVSHRCRIVPVPKCLAFSIHCHLLFFTMVLIWHFGTCVFFLWFYVQNFQ